MKTFIVDVVCKDDAIVDCRWNVTSWPWNNYLYLSRKKQQTFVLEVILGYFKVFQANLSYFTLTLNYCWGQNIMNLDIFLISRERKLLESCGFRHLKEKCGCSKTVLNYCDYQLVKQASFWLRVFEKHISTNYDFQFIQSIAKTFLCQSMQGRSF